MQCLILFRDATGWLPTGEELRRCGFRVSAAALPAVDAAADKVSQQGRGLALAAEPTEAYGSKPLAAAAATGSGLAAETDPS